MDEPSDLASLAANPERIQAALDFLDALENLEVSLVVNGTEFRGALRYSETNAVIEVVIDTES